MPCFAWGFSSSLEVAVFGLFKFFFFFLISFSELFIFKFLLEYGCFTMSC